MAKRIWSIFGASAMVVGMSMGALQGCAADPTASESEKTTAVGLPQGLTVLPTTKENAINLAFKKGDNAIFIQALRGRATPPSYQMTEGAPKFEIDARFVADNGRVFYSRKGGDEWIDPTWNDDFARYETMKPTRISNEALFQLASEAVKQFDAVLPAQLGVQAKVFAPEINAMREFGETAVARFAEQKVRALEHAKKIGTVINEVPYGTNGPEDADFALTAQNYYYVALHDQAIDATLGIGRHSATRIYVWGGAWQWVHDFCNHGSCAGSMGVKCNVQYSEALTEVKSWTANTCKTGYDAFSNDGHNCHDDSRVQMSNFVYGKTNNGYQAWCADGDGNSDISSWPGDESGSPVCTSYGAKGYNYAGWCDYNYSDGYNCPSSWQGTDDGCDCNCTFPDGTMADPDCKNK